MSVIGASLWSKPISTENLVKELKLDPRKKTVLLCPHLLWDGTAFWGEDLFYNYQEWLEETLKAATDNERVNWIVKLHPANIVMDTRDGVSHEHGEAQVISEVLDAVPSHFRVLPPDTKINTLSLLELVDYCVTVRGTVGLEAAAFGVVTLTAGTGRYDNQGFTVDSQTRADYLTRLSTIEKIPRMETSQVELARRYAYGTFLCRPLPILSNQITYQKNATAQIQSSLERETWGEFLSGRDVRQARDWIVSGDEDFFQSPT